MEYRDREALKSAGWKVFSNESLSPEARRHGLMNIIRAHYERSKEAWEATTGTTHPDFATYAAHWLRANGARVQAVAPATVDRMKEIYAPPATGNIQTDHTYWQEVKTLDHRPQRLLANGH